MIDQLLKVLLLMAIPVVPYTSALIKALNQGEGPLHRAARGQDVSTIRYLLKEGEDPNAVNKYQYTPLHLVPIGGSLKIAKILVANGARVTARNDRGETPRDIAVSWRENDIAEFLKAEEEKIKFENNEE